MPIRIAVVAGHTLTRYGLRELASRQPDLEIAAECGSAAGALGEVAAAGADVVLLDLPLPDGDGLRLARNLRAAASHRGIVVLGAAGQDDMLLLALAAGASAFVARTAPVGEMLAAIRHAAVAASSFTASGLAVALRRQRVRADRLALSPREAEVLRLLRDGLPVPAIAAAMFISHSTARTYVARLYEKLGAANRAQAIVAAMRYGLIQYAPAARAAARRAGLTPRAA